jgi:phosphohistidine phosphatase
MELIVFRHGIAEDRATGKSDADRPLTAEGLDKTGRAAAGLLKIAPRPQVILTSPKTRAVQTAELAGQAFGIRLETAEVLATGDVAAMLDALAGRDERRIMIVGHEPDFSEIIERLIFGRMTGTIELKKAGAALIDIAGRIDTARVCGMLRWLATPKMLREMG